MMDYSRLEEVLKNKDIPLEDYTDTLAITYNHFYNSIMPKSGRTSPLLSPFIAAYCRAVACVLERRFTKSQLELDRTLADEIEKNVITVRIDVGKLKLQIEDTDHDL